MKKIGLLTFLLFIIGTVYYFITDNYSEFSGSKIKNPDYYYLNFTRMNQKDEKTFDLNKGDCLSVDYQITKGDFLLQISHDGTVIYSGNEDNSLDKDFVINISEDGEYHVYVDARHAKGKLEISVK